MLKRVGVVTMLLAVPFAAPALGQGAAAGALTNIDATLETIRAKHSLPALGAVVVRGDQTVALGAVGVRRTDRPDKVTVDDRWHLGSCTKSMTAVVIARLVEQGRLSLNTTLSQAFPEFSGLMKPPYRAVTLAMLLNHRAGLPAMTSPTPKSSELFYAAAGRSH